MAARVRLVLQQADDGRRPDGVDQIENASNTPEGLRRGSAIFVGAAFGSPLAVAPRFMKPVEWRSFGILRLLLPSSSEALLGLERRRPVVGRAVLNQPTRDAPGAIAATGAWRFDRRAASAASASEPARHRGNVVAFEIG